MDPFRRWMFGSNGRAVTAVFFGAIGLFAFGVILGPIAIGFGLIALGEIRRNGGPGRATAIVGVVLGVAAFALAVVLAST